MNGKLNKCIGDFELGPIPPDDQGKQKMYLTMMLNANGVLDCKAVLAGAEGVLKELRVEKVGLNLT